MLMRNFGLIVCLSLASFNVLANNEGENNKPSSHFPVPIVTVISITGMVASAYRVLTTDKNHAFGLAVFCLSGALGLVQYHHDCEDKYLDKYARLQKEQHELCLKDQYNTQVALQERMLARREEIKKNRANSNRENTPSASNFDKN